MIIDFLWPLRVLLSTDLGEPRTGHRCPGEQIVVALLSALAVRLARLTTASPSRTLTSLRRIPARPTTSSCASVAPPADAEGDGDATLRFIQAVMRWAISGEQAHRPGDRPAHPRAATSSRRRRGHRGHRRYRRRQRW